MAQTIPTAPRRLLTPPDAAAYLGIEPKMLKRLRQEGEIACVEFGPRTHLFDPADMDAFIARKRRPAGWEESEGGRA